MGGSPPAGATRPRAAHHYTPLVLGPETLPREALENLEGRPYAALLQTVMFLKNRADLPLLETTLTTMDALSETEWLIYHEFLRGHLNSSRFTKEGVMALEDTIYYKRAVKALTDAEARGRAKGKAEGARSALIRVISQHMGARLSLPGPEALARMETLPLETLEKLALEMFAFQSHDDLADWLGRQA